MYIAQLRKYSKKTASEILEREKGYLKQEDPAEAMINENPVELNRTIKLYENLIELLVELRNEIYRKPRV